MDSTFQKRKSENVRLRKFIDSTGCDGVIKIYGNFSRTTELGMYEFYELMELADKDWEKEITMRRDSLKFYQEYELINLDEITITEKSKLFQKRAILGEYQLIESLEYKKNKEINICNNMSYMFYKCFSYIKNMSEFNTQNIIDISYMLYGCSLLIFLSDISD